MPHCKLDPAAIIILFSKKSTTAFTHMHSQQRLQMPVLLTAQAPMNHSFSFYVCVAVRGSLAMTSPRCNHTYSNGVGNGRWDPSQRVSSRPTDYGGIGPRRYGSIPTYHFLFCCLLQVSLVAGADAAAAAAMTKSLVTHC